MARTRLMARTRRDVAILASVAAGIFALAACDAGGVLGTPPSTLVVTDVVTTVTASVPVQGGVLTTPEKTPTAISPSESPVEVPTGQGLDSAVAMISGTVGVAIAPVGGRVDPVSAGTWRSGAAWSTIKVPLAIAVERSGNGALDGASSAITSSDNDAAQRLWDSLGGGISSSSAIQAELVAAGDVTTRVPSTVTRPPYSIFGQTQWSLADQARFGSTLPCLGAAGRVVDLMGQISPDQAWGLGRIPGAKFKGGWGPGESGGYVVRQFGILPGAGGDVAVAIAVESPTFESGTVALSQFAESVAPVLAATPGGTC